MRYVQAYKLLKANNLLISKIKPLPTYLSTFSNHVGYQFCEYVHEKAAIIIITLLILLGHFQTYLALALCEIGLLKLILGWAELSADHPSPVFKRRVSCFQGSSKSLICVRVISHAFLQIPHNKLKNLEIVCLINDSKDSQVLV